MRARYAPESAVPRSTWRHWHAPRPDVPPRQYCAAGRPGWPPPAPPPCVPPAPALPWPSLWPAPPVRPSRRWPAPPQPPAGPPLRHADARRAGRRCAVRPPAPGPPRPARQPPRARPRPALPPAGPPGAAGAAPARVPAAGLAGVPSAGGPAAGAPRPASPAKPPWHRLPGHLWAAAAGEVESTRTPAAPRAPHAAIRTSQSTPTDRWQVRAHWRAALSVPAPCIWQRITHKSDLARSGMLQYHHRRPDPSILNTIVSLQQDRQFRLFAQGG